MTADNNLRFRNIDTRTLVQVVLRLRSDDQMEFRAVYWDMLIYGADESLGRLHARVCDMRSLYNRLTRGESGQKKISTKCGKAQ